MDDDRPLLRDARRHRSPGPRAGGVADPVRDPAADSAGLADAGTGGGPLARRAVRPGVVDARLAPRRSARRRAAAGDGNAGGIAIDGAARRDVYARPRDRLSRRGPALARAAAAPLARGGAVPQ